MLKRTTIVLRFCRHLTFEKVSSMRATVGLLTENPSLGHAACNASVSTPPCHLCIRAICAGGQNGSPTTVSRCAPFCPATGWCQPLKAGSRQFDLGISSAPEAEGRISRIQVIGPESGSSTRPRQISISCRDTPKA